MAAHFAYFASLAGLLSKKIPEDELVEKLMVHFPANIRCLWLLSGKKSLIQTSEFLQRIEGINSTSARQSSSLSQRQFSTAPPTRRYTYVNPQYYKAKTSGQAPKNTLAGNESRPN